MAKAASAAVLDTVELRFSLAPDECSDDENTSQWGYPGAGEVESSEVVGVELVASTETTATI
ncbi:hypothetical protein [Microbacterium sp. LBN7]|uniref:hypothetical protein n=1 Tax=Microbacterium sp. LBN7 TaxID=3129773 RepID=UPI00324A4BB3